MQKGLMLGMTGQHFHTQTINGKASALGSGPVFVQGFDSNTKYIISAPYMQAKKSKL